MLSLNTPTYSPQEYLALEETAQERHEYIDGEIRLMPGGTPTHNSISVNLLFFLKLALGNQPYKIFHADQRLWIPEKNIYTYPDLVVTRKPVELKSDRLDTIINPVLVAEILSKSTRSYDYGEKFAAYRTITDLQEYLLVDPYQIQIEHYVKTSESQWLLTVYTSVDAVLSLDIMDIQIKIADIYEDIEFESCQSV